MALLISSSDIAIATIERIKGEWKELEGCREDCVKGIVDADR